MTEKTRQSHRRASLLLIAGLLLTTLTAGWILKGQAASRTSSPGWSHAPSAGPVSVRARPDRTAVLAGEDGQVRLELVLAAEKRARRNLSLPTDLLVVLDRSGSMEGEKLEHGLAAIRELIAQVGEADRFALVTYSYEAELALPLSKASRSAKRHWERLLDGIEADGGTNMSHGLELAYETLRASRGDARAARVILISDGLANHGDSSEQGLTMRAARFTKLEQVLSTVGVGLDFNEYLMSKLADAGTGNYYYLERSRTRRGLRKGVLRHP